jgi:predicted glycoside hydrolase/deacetylase ChbG (UPF0249 family)
LLPPVSERTLVVNGDDFGLSTAVNRGIIQAHEQGILTSASLMVSRPGTDQAPAAADGKALSVGLHLEVSDDLVRSQSPETVRAEIRRQLERFERLMGGPPTHLDSHHHVHRAEPVKGAALEVGRRLGVPVREFMTGISYNGDFYGQDEEGRSILEAIGVEALVAQIEKLQPGVTELGCHPATEVDHQSSYRTERIRELETLCDPRVQAAIKRCGVALRTFVQVCEAPRNSG